MSGAEAVDGKLEAPAEKPGFKVFVGGLSWDTNNEGLLLYFEKFGRVLDCVVMKDRNSGRSRGFGFVTYESIDGMEKALTVEHTLDGRQVELKRAMPRGEVSPVSQVPRVKKIFVGGLNPSTSEASMRGFFEKYGKVTEVVIMMDRATNRPRGFGFVSFDSEDTVERLMESPRLELDGKMVELKRAEPKVPAGMRNTAGYAYGAYTSAWPGAAYGAGAGGYGYFPGYAASGYYGAGSAGWTGAGYYGAGTYGPVGGSATSFSAGTGGYGPPGGSIPAASAYQAAYPSLTQAGSQTGETETPISPARSQTTRQQLRQF